MKKFLLIFSFFVFAFISNALITNFFEKENNGFLSASYATTETYGYTLHKHKWEYIKIDDEEHIKKCAHCTFSQTYSHAYKSDGICVCGAEKTCNHKYTYSVDPTNSNYHIGTCSCGKKTRQIGHEFQYTVSTNKTTDDTHIGTCKTCGYQTGKLNHSYKENQTTAPFRCKFCSRKLVCKENTHDLVWQENPENSEQHIGTCKICGFRDTNFIEEHHYVNGYCKDCAKPDPILADLNNNNMQEGNGTSESNNANYQTNNEPVWPVPGYTKYNTRSGDGVDSQAWDIPAALRAPVVATKSGKIISQVEYYPDYYDTGEGGNKSLGNNIMIAFDDGTYGMYAHLTNKGEDAFPFEVGDTVNAGDVIGYVGSSGHSSGAHLHFEIVRPNLSYSDNSPYAQFYNGTAVDKSNIQP